MVQMWDSTFTYPTSESASIVSNKGMNGRQSMFFSANYPFRPTYTKNKRMCGVNQKVAPGLSATIHMKLKRKHSGVKLGSDFYIPVTGCCLDESMICPPGFDKSNCPYQE